MGDRADEAADSLGISCKALGNSVAAWRGERGLGHAGAARRAGGWTGAAAMRRRVRGLGMHNVCPHARRGR